MPPRSSKKVQEPIGFLSTRIKKAKNKNSAFQIFVFNPVCRIFNLISLIYNSALRTWKKKKLIKKPAQPRVAVARQHINNSQPNIIKAIDSAQQQQQQQLQSTIVAAAAKQTTALTQLPVTAAKVIKKKRVSIKPTAQQIEQAALSTEEEK